MRAPKSCQGGPGHHYLHRQRAQGLGLPHRPLPHPGAQNLRQDETGQAGKVSDAKLYA